MKKLLRNWWVLVIGVVVLVPLGAMIATPARPGFTVHWVWLRPAVFGVGYSSSPNGENVLRLGVIARVIIHEQL